MGKEEESAQLYKISEKATSKQVNNISYLTVSLLLMSIFLTKFSSYH
jgi:hypothetical protein